MTKTLPPLSPADPHSARLSVQQIALESLQVISAINSKELERLVSFTKRLDERLKRLEGE